MAPDLEVIVKSAALTRDRAAAIADAQWPADTLWVAADHSVTLTRLTRRGHAAGALNIGAHDILGDDADWNAPTWRFEPAHLHRLVATVRRFYELLPEEFTLLAAWVGEEPLREESVTRAALLSIIEANELGNRVLYRVAAG